MGKGSLRWQTQCKASFTLAKDGHCFTFESVLKKSELLRLFKEACGKHDKLMGEASNNAGCDRHLLGLRLMANELGMEVPEIYKDIAWTKS